MNLCPLKWFNIRLIAFWSFTNRGKFWVNDEFPVQFSSVAHLHSYRENHKHTNTHTYIFWFGSSFDSRPNNDSNLLLLMMIFIPLARGANALYNKVHCSVGSKIAKVQHGSSSSKKECDAKMVSGTMMFRMNWIAVAYACKWLSNSIFAVIPLVGKFVFHAREKCDSSHKSNINIPIVRWDSHTMPKHSCRRRRGERRWGKLTQNWCIATYKDSIWKRTTQSRFSKSWCRLMMRRCLLYNLVHQKRHTDKT